MIRPELLSAKSAREFVDGIFEHRRSRNLRYSLRAFARDLALSPSFLSEFLAGKHLLSRARAEEVASELGLCDAERSFFCDLAELEGGKDVQAREWARIRLERVRAERELRELDLDSFLLISDWFHLAILEVLSLDGVVPHAPAIAARLGPETECVEEALLRLDRLGLVRPRPGFPGHYEVTHSRRRVGREVPSSAIKRYHGQILDKAKGALVSQPLERREFVTVTYSLNRETLPRAKELIGKFRQEMSALLAEKSGHDDVYCLAVQFFSLLE